MKSLFPVPGDNLRMANTEHPKLRRAWASRARRRRHVVLLVVLLLTGTALLGWLPLLGQSGWDLLLLPVFAAVMGWTLFLGYRLEHVSRMSLPHRLLDERQSQERDRAHRFSHRVMTAILTFCFLAVAFALYFFPTSVLIPAWLAIPLLWLLLMTHNSVPAAYLAWTQPDEILDDEADPAHP